VHGGLKYFAWSFAWHRHAQNALRYREKAEAEILMRRKALVSKYIERADRWIAQGIPFPPHVISKIERGPNLDVEMPGVYSAILSHMCV
jgi:hypothetical protein